MSSEEYEKIIEELKKENETLKEENDIVWDMCNELRASDIKFDEGLQNMIKSIQEDAFYHAWIKKVVDNNEENADKESN
tara:strand:+ start:194 stop:430 length:237 start_codon:yes stop_codon:yes gene_type:complete